MRLLASHAAVPLAPARALQGALRGNRVLLVLCAMYLVFYVDRVNIAAAAPLIQHDLKLSNVVLGLAFSAFAYPYALFQVFGGWFGDRFGVRRTFGFAGTIVSLATAMTGLVTSGAALALARFGLGFGEGAVFPTAARALAENLPREQWGFAQGATHACARIANALTPPLVAFAILFVSWRLTFVGFALLSLSWTLLAVVFFRRPGRDANVTASGEARPKLPWLRLARRILPATVVDFCYGWTLWVFLSWLPSFFFKHFHLDVQHAALFASAVLLAGVLGDVAGGTLSDLLLVRTGNVTRARRDVIVGGLLGAAVFLVPVVFVHDFTAVTVALGCAFFCAELVVAPIWSAAMSIAPDYAGTASGMMNLGFGIAGILSPVVFGAVIDVTHSWTLPFAASVLLLPIGAAVAFAIRAGEPFVMPASAPRAR
ncbi:MAG TPA: MFS transporter [Candidatus Sulfotelmatobacter sp.]|nr:MFS transporter [Candidatus Sulfotelmatobacter sp.]